jgi:hypothetical protein
LQKFTVAKGAKVTTLNAVAEFGIAKHAGSDGKKSR